MWKSGNQKQPRKFLPLLVQEYPCKAHVHSVHLVATLPSLRLCVCLPGLGPWAYVTAARILSHPLPSKGTCTIRQETRCSSARERAVAQLGSALEWGSRGRGVRIPPARVSVFLEDSFGLKRFQREGGVTGYPKERQNRYNDASIVMILTSPFFTS